MELLFTSVLCQMATIGGYILDSYIRVGIKANWKLVHVSALCGMFK